MVEPVDTTRDGRVDPEAAAMYALDATAPAFGIELLAASADGATVRMTVRADMCNGLGIAHGGMVFLLCDSAMAFASNAELPDGTDALAVTAEIDWLAPVRDGDTLTAVATFTAGVSRTRIWDVRVTDQNERLVAVFRGRTRTVTR
ncbi:MAG TPA: hotdog fold thioesterase [Ilumatobacter sp.]|nr:hotdog fold thioesterase [Ilumatobacter sp.]